MIYIPKIYKNQKGLTTICFYIRISSYCNSFAWSLFWNIETSPSNKFTPFINDDRCPLPGMTHPRFSTHWRSEEREFTDNVVTDDCKLKSNVDDKLICQTSLVLDSNSTDVLLEERWHVLATNTSLYKVTNFHHMAWTLILIENTTENCKKYIS